MSNYKDDFLDCELEPFFYTALNTDIPYRKKVFDEHNRNLSKGDVKWDSKLLDKWNDIPFLNGGLFERDENDSVRSVFPEQFFKNRKDGIENYDENFVYKVPNVDKGYGWDRIPGLFDFFDQYNFTIDENDPNDAEVGVDPEMLGKIFENLLEDNKDKGAFYTPKEIVQYMCKESLIAYLVTEAKKKSSKKNEDYEDFARSFVNNPYEITEKIKNKKVTKQLVDIDDSLKDVKICDPAIGSGAFPMGMLNELVACREAINNALGNNITRAELKKHIIQNNIYGVDIEKGAIDIARLRFWLSIVVDENDNNPKALPNFDYKFMQGNSLLEYFEGVDLTNIVIDKKKLEKSPQLSFSFDHKDNLENLQIYLKKYFSVKDHLEKEEMHKNINDEVKRYIENYQGCTPKIKTALKGLDVDANNKFFLWHTWFKDVFEKGGFDIVIGNPPYVQMKKGFVDKKRFPYSEEKDKGKQNLYKLFVEHSYNILKENGICSLITQSSLMCDSSSQYTRELLLQKTCLCQVIEFPKVAPHAKGQLFQGALVATCICLFTKTLPNIEHTFLLSANNDLTTLNNFDFAVMEQALPMKFYPQGYCFPLIRKHDFDIILKMNNGTMFLKSFIQSSSQGDFNLTNESHCFSTTPTDVKMYRGCHVHRYYIDKKTEEYIQNNHKSNYVTNNENNIFLVCQNISGMTDKQRFNVAISNKIRCLYGHTVNKIFLKEGTSPSIIMAILNSKIIDWYFRKTSTNNHINIYELEQLPIPTSISSNHSIIALVDKILVAKKENPQADTSEWEKEIDEIVYHLYGLTYDEVLVVDPETEVTREKYERK